MRKLAIRIIAAFLTLSIGIASFVLWSVYYTVKDIPVLRERLNIPEGWKKIEVKGKFSFYLPPDMKTVELSCYGETGGLDLLENQDLGLIYSYNERKSCDQILNPADKETLQILNVEINGKSAWQEKNQSEIYLCFPDVGDGKTGLNLGIMYKDERGADLARQILDTIEFR